MQSYEFSNCNNKVALNRDDDKEMVIGVSTVACGHNPLCWNSLLAVISIE